MKTSKSPNAVAQWAYTIAQAGLPTYAHEFSPKKYTQHQLFALLILKQFFKKDYRGLMGIIEDSSDIKKILKLREIPHFTTLQKASRRLLSSDKVQKLLKKTLKAAQVVDILTKTSALSAMDSTGMETGHTSNYFVKRKQRELHKEGYQTTTYKRFPKLTLNCDCTSHIISGLLTSRGPSVDVTHFKQLLKQSHANHPIETITADAGYDSESNHTYAREVFGVHSIINPKVGRPTKKLPTGTYRKEMVVSFDKKIYGQRWQSETVMSMLKRNLGEELLSKSFWAQCREMSLKVLTHNITILMPV